MAVMTAPELQGLFDRVRRGDLDPSIAAGLILTALRAAPFEDMWFARVDTHRALRQGFPEVILGIGKTPPQIAAIAERIVTHGQALLVTRADPEAYDAVRARVPGWGPAQPVGVPGGALWALAHQVTGRNRP